MELAVSNNLLKGKSVNREINMSELKNLTDARINQPYEIKGIDAYENGMENFLFTLGCYEGEKITIISISTDNYIIHIKDARYSIDVDLAKAILI